VEQPELAVPELAPDWAEYIERRTWPLVRVLGRYPVGWKRSFADQTFYRKPEKLDDKRLRQYVPLVALKYKSKPPGEKRSPAETEILNPHVATEFPPLAEELLTERKAWERAHPKPSKEERQELRKLGLTLAMTVPPQKLKERFPRIRHVQVEKQPGGRLARVKPHDGPPRKIQLKKASEAVVFWLAKGQSLNKLAWSIRWPTVFQKFGVPRHDPPVPEGVRILDIWPRYKLIWLDQETGHAPGFYRVKEFSKNGVIVLPENAVSDEIAKRLGLQALRKPNGAAKQTAESPEGNGQENGETNQDVTAGQVAGGPTGKLREVKLGKKDLVTYFGNVMREDKKTEF
jgi:hypothetical protein